MSFGGVSALNTSQKGNCAQTYADVDEIEQFVHIVNH